ncbi:MAG: ATP-dependent DNA ligase [Thermoanaerobaculia bacterium]|nr:ATP-dependent DNA ligase [Thermoanaerobaculia bacterium]
MKRFTRLYAALDETTRTPLKVEAMAEYFRESPPEDAAWAVHFLSGERPKRLVGWTRVRAWAVEAAAIPEWLFDECYHAVGDLAETIALLVPGADRASELPLHRWVEERLLPLRGADEDGRRTALLAAWSELDAGQLFVWNKLITGGFRVGVSQRLVLRAPARASAVEPAVLAHRLMGRWRPSANAYRALLAPQTGDADVSRPYPFCLAHPLEGEPGSLGALDEWQAEWKWDGIRAQLVRRGGGVYLWSRGEEMVTERYPEPAEAAELPADGAVVDGELLAWSEGRPLPFAELQRRIGRKRPGATVLREVPVALVAHDLLEEEGADVRERPLAWRRERLERLVAELPAGAPIHLSPRVEAASWDELAELQTTARERRAEGLMLKRRGPPYRVGRRRGDWWKWKVDPYSVDAVLLYAQRGHGRRASLYTDYTFAVWDGDALVPFAKAYSGLTDAEIREVDRFVRRNSLERFGPARSVRPELAFELHFEGIQRSTRHKSGIAVRFPRMARWRRDKRAAEADTLETVRGLLERC